MSSECLGGGVVVVFAAYQIQDIDSQSETRLTARISISHSGSHIRLGGFSASGPGTHAGKGEPKKNVHVIEYSKANSSLCIEHRDNGARVSARRPEDLDKPGIIQ